MPTERSKTKKWELKEFAQLYNGGVRERGGLVHEDR